MSNAPSQSAGSLVEQITEKRDYCDVQAAEWDACTDDIEMVEEWERRSKVLSEAVTVLERLP